MVILLFAGCGDDGGPDCIDNDGDSYGEHCSPGPDCDDTNPGHWQDCGVCVDNDDDGYGVDGSVCDWPGDDCDVTDTTINPGEDEICGNSVDENCDDQVCVFSGDTPADWSHYLISDTCASGIMDTWTNTNARYHGPDWSWYSGTEQICGDLALESPDIDLSLNPNPSALVFWTWYSFDDCGDPTFEPDGGIVEISDDGGPWTQIYPVDGYPYTINDDWCGGANPLLNLDVYAHGSDGWEQEIFDLSAYAGQVVKIRFRVGWDCGWCEQHEGWYIDDIFVADCPDADRDGFSICDGDCDDGNPDVYPGSDADGDGYLGCMDDCDDTDATINPGATEVCGNCLNENCNYSIDEGCGEAITEVEPNNYIASANAIPGFDSTISGESDPSGDWDIFSINVCDGQTVRFDCDADEYGSPLDCWLELWDSGGSYITGNDDACDPDTGWCGLDSYFSYTFATGGTYYIAVTSCCPGGGGGPGYWYDLLIRQVCPIPDGDGDRVTVCDGDCNDSDDSVYLGAIESCDGKDNDCDDVVDDDCVPVVFSEDFELGAPGWTTTLYGGATDDLWHLTELLSYSSTHSMWCGDEITGEYRNNMDNAVISPGIDLTGSTIAVLFFWEFYDVEWDFDFCIVDISTDGGSSWTPLKGPYEGDSGGWVLTSIDISTYVDNTINIRFRFTSDMSITYPGWFVDDVTVYAD